MQEDATTPPPPPPLIETDSTESEAAGVNAPGRGAVFFHLLWRSIVLAIVGGAVIGFVVVLGFVIFDDDTPLGDAGLAAYFGAWVGLLLGLLAGIVIGIVGSIMLVPYKGRARTVGIVRVVAVLSVAGFFLLLFSTALDEYLVWILIAASVLGAALLSPWLVKWYIKRMEPAGR